MKLKLQTKQIEFKLSQQEKLDLVLSGQCITEKIVLPDNQCITYSIVLTSDEKEKFAYSNNKIELCIPWQNFEILAVPSKKGISFSFDTLIVKVVVDLLPRKKNDI